MPGNLPELRGVDHFLTFTNLGGQGTYEWNPLVVDGKEEPSSTRYIATELTNRALRWLDAHLARGKSRAGASGNDHPFALMLSHKSVHADFKPDEPDRGRYQNAAVELPKGAHAWTHQAKAQYAHMTYLPLSDAVRVYGEAITSMDREIGRVLDWLDEHGLAQNTLVIYASDNGYMWGEHGLTDKRWAYEDSIRIPLLVRLPSIGHPKGARSDAIVANVDLAPTLLELAGFGTPAHMQGKSFVPILRDPSRNDDANPWRSELLYSYYFEPPYPAPTVNALVTPRFKYVETHGRGNSLYDLERDPGELQNLIESVDPQTLADLKGRFAAMQSQVRH
jgi:N-acetylglucosamine-6-sulfatase